MKKLGSSTRGTLYIQLTNFLNHYLVLVITDEGFRYALITTRVVTESTYAHMLMEDIAWLDFDRIHGGDEMTIVQSDASDPTTGLKRKRDISDESGRNGLKRPSGSVGCVGRFLVLSQSHHSCEASISKHRSCANCIVTVGQDILLLFSLMCSRCNAS